MVSGGSIVQYFIIGEQLSVTANTILLYDLLPFLPDHNYLGFIPESKDCCVSHSVLGLEPVFDDCILVWNMTVVTAGMLSVRAVPPGCVLWSHNVAVHTGGRII